MGYPTAAQVTAGVVFGASNELTGTGADAAALVAAQLATDVAEVDSKKASIKDDIDILDVTGTYDFNAAINASADAQLATDVAAVTAQKPNMLLAASILGVAGDGLSDTQLQKIRNHPLLKL